MSQQFTKHQEVTVTIIYAVGGNVDLPGVVSKVGRNHIEVMVYAQNAGKPFIFSKATLRNKAGHISVAPKAREEDEMLRQSKLADQAWAEDPNNT